jgi:hypothetical protein
MQYPHLNAAALVSQRNRSLCLVRYFVEATGLERHENASGEDAVSACRSAPSAELVGAAEVNYADDTFVSDTESPMKSCADVTLGPPPPRENEPLTGIFERGDGAALREGSVGTVDEAPSIAEEPEATGVVDDTPGDFGRVQAESTEEHEYEEELFECDVDA